MQYLGTPVYCVHCTGGIVCIHPILMSRCVTKRELAEYCIVEVTNQFESSVNLIRHLLDKKFLQLSLYRPPKKSETE